MNATTVHAASQPCPSSAGSFLITLRTRLVAGVLPAFLGLQGFDKHSASDIAAMTD